MNDKEFYLILGFVKISQYRINTLKSIGETLKMPSEIARENNYKTSQVSSALYDFHLPIISLVSFTAFISTLVLSSNDKKKTIQMHPIRSENSLPYKRISIP